MTDKYGPTANHRGVNLVWDSLDKRRACLWSSKDHPGLPDNLTTDPDYHPGGHGPAVGIYLSGAKSTVSRSGRCTPICRLSVPKSATPSSSGTPRVTGSTMTFGTGLRCGSQRIAIRAEHKYPPFDRPRTMNDYIAELTCRNVANIDRSRYFVVDK